jgi:hypothetical protein
MFFFFFFCAKIVSQFIKRKSKTIQDKQDH